MTQQSPWWCRAFGHKMRPRYSTVPISMVASEPNYGFGPSEMTWRTIEHKRVYEGDVCRRCGLTAKPQREDADAA